MHNERCFPFFALGAVVLLLTIPASTARAQVSFGPPGLLYGGVPGVTSANSQTLVATDGSGTWMAAWFSWNMSGPPGQSATLTARSTDNGATWSPAVDTGLPGGAKQITTDHDSWLLVYCLPDAVGISGSTDNGQTWSLRSEIPSTAQCSYPDLITSAGNWLAVWTSIYYPPPPTPTEPHVPAGPAPPPIITILAARSTDAGATWTAPSSIASTSDRASDFQPRIAGDADGVVNAVWGDGADGQERVWTARSTDGGATWSSPAQLSAEDQVLNRGPEIACDGAGQCVATWSTSQEIEGAASWSNIVAAHSTDAGATWSAPLQVNANAPDRSGVYRHNQRPRIATDGMGRWVIAWSSYDEFEGGTYGLNLNVYVAASADVGATWSASMHLAKRSGQIDADADVAADGQDHWLAVWYGSGSSASASIWAARGDVCGNGIVAGGEQCDDGNLVNGDGCSSTCQSELLSDSALSLRNTAASTRTAASASLRLRARDRRIALGEGNFSADDPVLHGATLHLVSKAAGIDLSFDLPSSNWRYIGRAGRNRGYRYKDRHRSGEPIRSVVVRAGSMIKLIGTGQSLRQSLASNPDPLDVTLVTGGHVYQMEFGGKTKFEAGRVFSARTAR